jgi:hypothetical protein
VRRILLLVAALAVAAGCSATPVPGTPAPAAGPSVETGGLELPPRPREIRLDGVDPCSLLTPEQRAELGLAGAPLPYDSKVPYFVGPACSFSGFEPRAIAVSFALTTGNGIDALLAPDAVKDELTATTIAGFPAVLARPRIPDFCSIDVDVAEGQLLDVQMADGGREPPVPQDELCRDVVGIAERAVLNLQSR